MTHAELAPVARAAQGQGPRRPQARAARMHPHAMDAATAGVLRRDARQGRRDGGCALHRAGRGAHAGGLREVAAKHGLDVDRFRACVQGSGDRRRGSRRTSEAFRAGEGPRPADDLGRRTKLEGAQGRRAQRPSTALEPCESTRRRRRSAPTERRLDVGLSAARIRRRVCGASGRSARIRARPRRSSCPFALRSSLRFLARLPRSASPSRLRQGGRSRRATIRASTRTRSRRASTRRT